MDIPHCEKHVHFIGSCGWCCVAQRDGVIKRARISAAEVCEERDQLRERLEAEKIRREGAERSADRFMNERDRLRDGLQRIAGDCEADCQCADEYPDEREVWCIYCDASALLDEKGGEPSCPECGCVRLRKETASTLMYPPRVLGAAGYRCKACGHAWQDGDDDG